MFTVPIENVFVEDMKIGDIVTFSYENHTRRNVLVNLKINRIRYDALWNPSSVFGIFIYLFNFYFIYIYLY